MIDDRYDTDLAAIRDALPAAYRDRRLPRITSPFPDWTYLIAIVVPDPTGQDLYRAAEPDPAEVAELARYLDHKRRFYNDRCVRMLLDRPLDVIGGHNTLSLLKRTDGGWCHRRSTWTIGPLLSPPPDDDPLTLTELLDLIEAHGTAPNPAWEQFKAANPLVGYPVPDLADLQPTGPPLEHRAPSA